MEANKMILKTSDWVKGKSRHGELIIGYIDSMNVLKEAVNVTVVESDNEAIIGMTIAMPIQIVESIPAAETKEVAELEFLIDLALATDDKEWFQDLSSQLNEKKQAVN
ncbi:IDEAL domain-containing protein [Planococcus sp. 107-1]|uniref:IDEAL domain-containing protein n=1 Tax=Planococcus sp. 107-1 TaxID=2908840 RepID=UPI001F3512C0|nr:IDEAL domain-containing protein [Planococcus sp. 107-1]UJF25559.1 IDEAL domain-containing protein [Planococcus sp. 107-1]